MADWLPRPPIITSEPTNAGNESALRQDASKQVKYVNYLNRIDLQAIFEYFLLKIGLPSRLSEEWVKRNFVLYDNASYYLRKRPDEAGSQVMLKVPEIEDLTLEATKKHGRLAYASIGTTMRELSGAYWHLELILAAHEATQKSKYCQLMKPPDKTLPIPMPITPARPFTRWATDFTGPLFGIILLNAIEYTTR